MVSLFVSGSNGLVIKTHGPKNRFFGSLPQPFWIRFVISWSSVPGETCFGSKRLIVKAVALHIYFYTYLYIIKSPRMRYTHTYIYIYICIHMFTYDIYWHLTDIYSGYYCTWFFIPLSNKPGPFGSQTIWSRAAWRNERWGDLCFRLTNFWWLLEQKRYETPWNRENELLFSLPARSLMSGLTKLLWELQPLL